MGGDPRRPLRPHRLAIRAGFGGAIGQAVGCELTGCDKLPPMHSALRELLERVATWPEDAQADAAAALKAIDDALTDDYELTEDDLRAIDEGLEDARVGRFASDEEIKALFDRFRGT